MNTVATETQAEVAQNFPCTMNPEDLPVCKGDDCPVMGSDKWILGNFRKDDGRLCHDEVSNPVPVEVTSQGCY